jgi:FlaA1/EpsC-like NDP-sugar epimerase
LLVLTGAGVSAVFIETNWLTRGAGLEDLSRFVAVFLVLSILAMQVAGVYRRIWVRVTMRDVLSLQFWMLAAAMGTFTLFSLMFSHLEWSALRLTLLSYVLACAGVCMPRVVLGLLRDLGLDARYRNPKSAAGGGYGPAVVLGAGDLGALLLAHLKSSGSDLYPGLRILGFIDEMEVLHGRRLRSFQILGGLDLVPKLVAEEGLKGIILAINEPGQELLDRLDVLAGQYDLKIYRWQVGLGEA